MVDQVVNQADISNLAQKLEELGDVLSEKERTLLLAIFKLAGYAIASRLQGGSEGSQTESGTSGLRGATFSRGSASNLPSLAAGFRGAFQPLGNSSFNLNADLQKAAGGVGIGVVY